MQEFLSVDTIQLFLPCYITADACILAGSEMRIFCPINQKLLCRVGGRLLPLSLSVQLLQQHTWNSQGAGRTSSQVQAVNLRPCKV